MKYFLLLGLSMLAAGLLSAQCPTDNIPPVLVPKASVSATLGGAKCLAVLHPQDLLDAYSDNCTQQSAIQLRVRRIGAGYGFPFSPNGLTLTLTPADLAAPVIAEVWAKDTAGNTAFVFVEINVANPQGCTFALLPDTIGVGELVEVTWVLETQSPVLPDTVIFQIGDNFIFQEDLFAGANQDNMLTIYPQKDEDPLNGVSTYDLVLIMRALLEVEPFNHALMYIAADADRNNLVSPHDITELRNVILGIYTELPDNTSWRFIADDYVFPPPTNPIAGPIPESVTFDRHRTEPLPDFIPVKVGDINGTALLNSLVATDDRSLAAIQLPDMRLERGQTVQVPVALTGLEVLYGLQGALAFDPEMLEIMALLPGVLPDFSAENYYQPEPGVLTFSWVNPKADAHSVAGPLFFLEITAREPLVLSEVLQLKPTRLRAEAYENHGRTADLELRFDPSPVPVTDAILPAFPNPTTGDFFVPVRLAQAGHLRLEVFDLYGRLVFMEETDLPAGEHRLQAPATELGSSGVYVYRVSAGAVLVEQGKVRVSIK